MKQSDLIALIVTLLGVAAFAAVFTILYSKYVKSSIREVKAGARDVELIDRAIAEQDEKARRNKKIASIVGNVLFYTVLAVAVPVLIFAGVSKAQGNVMPFGDTAVMVVASGSMRMKNSANTYLVENNKNDQFNQYDIILLHKVPSFESVQQYDVIAFWNPDAKEVFIHRVIKIDEANRCFETRGDANGESDGHRPTFDEIKGIYREERVGGIGMLVLFFQSSSGIVTVVSVMYVLWMISFFTKKVEKAEEERTAKLAAIIQDARGPGPQGLSAAYHETIYYQGYCYRFDENGFVERVKHDTGYNDNTLVKVTSSEQGEIKQVIAVDKPPIDIEGGGDLTDESLEELGDLREEDFLESEPLGDPPKGEEILDLYDDE